MAEAVLGLFNDRDEAMRVVQALMDEGIDAESIQILNNDALSESAEMDGVGADGSEIEPGATGSKENLFDSLFTSQPTEAKYYQDAIRQGSTLIAVVAGSGDGAQLDRAAKVIERYDEVDVDSAEPLTRN